MDALVIVEELGRHGDVVTRHVLDHLPARIGRGYGVDVIVDDPHVAANHLDIRLTHDGRLEAVDLGSLNGTYRRGDATRIGTTPIHGDDVFHIGQTRLRIRLPDQAVPAELPLQQQGWDRHPAVFAGSAAFLVGFIAWVAYVSTFDTDTSGMLAIPVLFSLAVLVWVAVWSLVCRTLHGRANFWAHGVIAFLGFSILLLVDTLAGYLDFSFDLSGFDLVWTIALSAVPAGMLYRHLRLTVRLPPRILATLAIVLVALLIGGIEGYQAVREANKPGLQAYDKSIKPSVFLFSQGITPDQFVDATEKLKIKADKATAASGR